jgi:hypothetical protein
MCSLLPYSGMNFDEKCFSLNIKLQPTHKTEEYDFWDVMPSGSCKTTRLGGTYRRQLQGEKTEK